jgi:hypothetical protein
MRLGRHVTRMGKEGKYVEGFKVTVMEGDSFRDIVID